MFRAMVYSGGRQVQQFLGLTPGAQAAPRSSGGVVDLDRQFYGLDMRWSHRDRLLARPVTVTVGLNYDEQEEARRGWENFAGAGPSQVLGVQGRLRRDETNNMHNFDQYAQGELAMSDRLSVSGGVRNRQVSFSSRDHFVAGANPDDSGTLQFSQISPVAGALYKLTPLLHAYASYGKGFETPTFAELAYRVSTATGAGINTDLRPNKTTNYEVGAKAVVGDDTRVNVAAFHVDGDNEITTLTNTGGRAVFQNAGPSTRKGLSQTIGKVRLTEFARIDNLFDERYVGSVIVNETSRRYSESAPGRAFFAGVSAAITF